MPKSTFRPRPYVIIPLMIVAVALAVPQSRTYFLMQMGILQTRWGYTDSLLFETNKNQVFQTPRNNWEKWDQFISTVQSKPDKNYIDRYIESHPQLTWLLAERIRTLLNRYGLPHRGEEKIRVGLSPMPNNFSESERQKDIKQRKELFPRIVKLCRLGQQQEPQNAYYDVVLAVVSYGLFKDNQGWHYFQSASNKSDFDPHYQDLMHVQLYLVRQIVGHPMTWREKEISASVVMFRDLSYFRTLAQWLQWWASRDIRDGNISKAMEIMQTMHKVGSLMVHHAQQEYVASIGTYLTSLAAITPWKALQISYALPGPPHITLSYAQKFRYIDQFSREHHLPLLRQLVTSNFQLHYYILRARDRANQSRIDIGEMAMMTIS